MFEEINEISSGNILKHMDMSDDSGNFIEYFKNMHIIEEKKLSEYFHPKPYKNIFHFHLVVLEAWYIRASWSVKIHFVHKLVDILLYLGKEKIINDIYNFLRTNIMNWDNIFSHLKTPVTILDQVPYDDCRCLNKNVLSFQIKDDFKWFSQLKNFEQLLILKELIIIGGNPMCHYFFFTLYHTLENKFTTTESTANTIEEISINKEGKNFQKNENLINSQRSDIFKKNLIATPYDILVDQSKKDFEEALKDIKTKLIKKKGNSKKSNEENDWFKYLPGNILAKVLECSPESIWKKVNPYWQQTSIMVNQEKLTRLSLEKYDNAEIYNFSSELKRNSKNLKNKKQIPKKSFENKELYPHLKPNDEGIDILAYFLELFPDFSSFEEYNYLYKKEAIKYLIKIFSKPKLISCLSKKPVLNRKIEVNPKENFLISLSSNGGIELYSLPLRRIIANYLEGKSIESILLVSDNELVTGGRNQAHLWWIDSSFQNPIQTYEGHSSPITNLALSPDKKLITISNVIKVFDLKLAIEEYEIQTNPVVNHLIILDNNIIIYSLLNGELSCLELNRPGEDSTPFKTTIDCAHIPKEGIFVIASLSKNLIVTAGEDKFARIWQVPELICLLALIHSHSVYEAVPILDGQILLTADCLGNVYFWEMPKGQKIGKLITRPNIPEPIKIKLLFDNRMIVSSVCELNIFNFETEDLRNKNSKYIKKEKCPPISKTEKKIAYVKRLCTNRKIREIHMNRNILEKEITSEEPFIDIPESLGNIKIEMYPRFSQINHNKS